MSPGRDGNQHRGIRMKRLLVMFGALQILSIIGILSFAVILGSATVHHNESGKPSASDVESSQSFVAENASAASVDVGGKPDGANEIMGAPAPFADADTAAATVSKESLADGQQVTVKWDTVTGTPAFLTGPVTPPDKGGAYEDTIAFLKENSGLYLMDDPSAELQVSRQEQDDIGMMHLHMSQVYKGVPVFGAVLVAHLNADGDITAINGDYYPGLDLSVEPDIPVDDAVAIAEEALGFEAPASETEPPQLVVFARDGSDALLTWRVTLATDEPPLRTVYFVDAHEGKVVSSYDALEDARNRKTYSANYGTSLPGTLMISEGGPDTGDAVVNAAHYNAALTYDYYYNAFGRDSLNDAGMELRSSVHYSSNYNNAFWNGSQMAYGDGDGYVFSPLGNGLDVVAHELTHGVTQYTAGLVYSYQSGALNESYSDVFGAMVDRADWLMGEDVYTPQTPGDALRSLENPALYGQPAHMNNYVNTSSDNGGVHTNSGIPNKAAYNIATAIGKDKMEQIWYRTLSDYLTPGAQFTDARDASVQAASDLYGASSAEVAAVDSGFTAVGIGGSGPPSQTTARIEISHTYRGDLVVTLGVGDPDSPAWSTVVSNREGGSADNINLTVDITAGAAHLPPSWSNRWFLKVYDAAGYDTGTITKFTVTDHDTTYTATDVPVPIYDYQTSYSYIPTDDDTPPTVTGTIPDANASGFYASSDIRAVFSEQLASATVNASSFTLKESGSGTPVPVQVSYNNSTRTATLKPDSELAYSTAYTARLTTSITDLAGNHLGQEYQWSFTTAPPPKWYYFTWYDMLSPNMSDWVVMGNPSGSANIAGFDVYTGDVKVSTEPIEVQVGDTGAVTYPGQMGGPVKMASLSGDSKIISQRTLYGNSLEEVTGVEASSLDSHYYFPWYDAFSPGAQNWILIANPGDTPVEADIYIAGEKMNATTYNIGAGDTITPTFEGAIGGPVEVVAHEPGDVQTPRDVIASERTIWKSDFIELMGIPASGLGNDYVTSWYDQLSPGARAWVLVANPNTDKNLAAEIWIGGQRMTDSASGEQYFLVEPGQSVTPQFPGVMDGPVEVKGYDADTYDPVNPGIPDLNFYTTQRCLFGDSFEEISGYRTEDLATTNYFSWYDQSSTSVQDWVLVTNPGDSPIKAEIWIGGQRMRDSATGAQYFLVQPGESITPRFPGAMDGPVEVRGYNASSYNPNNPGTPDSIVFSSQRVLWKGHFSETDGVTLD